MNQSIQASQHNDQLLQLSHVAGQCRRYPGEEVTFYTRVHLAADLIGFRLRIGLPPGLEFKDYHVVDAPEASPPRITRSERGQAVIWDVVCRQKQSVRFEVETIATVLPSRQDNELSSLALAISKDGDGKLLRQDESASVAIFTHGSYLNHLPALYREDELMGRFLMLFESFLAPIGHQIGNLHLYFDPRLTPAVFLPWLASWLDLKLDDQWPEMRQRELLQQAAALNRVCGTRTGLERYLEVYSGGKARIVEHRAHRFELGPEARLGSGLALGTSDQAHTFSVYLRLPPLAETDSEAKSRREEARRRQLESIIQARKPAHTAFRFHLEVDPSLEALTTGPAAGEGLSSQNGR